MNNEEREKLKHHLHSSLDDGDVWIEILIELKEIKEILSSTELERLFKK